MPRSVQRFIYYAVLSFAFLLLSSATVDAFLTKWAPITLDAAAPQYLPKVLGFQTTRPYLYRVLTPFVVAKTVSALEHTSIGTNRPLLARAVQRYAGDIPLDSIPDSLRLGFLVSSLWMVAFSFGALWSLRACALALPVSAMPADFATVLFGLVLPVSFRGGSGFLYDFSEIFFVAAYLAALLWKRTWLTPLLLAAAVVNKESNLLLLVYYGLYIASFPRDQRPKPARMLLECLAALIPYLATKFYFAHSPGAGIEFHLWENIPFWLSASTYFSVGTTHLQFVLFPHPSNLVFLALTILLLAIGLPLMKRMYKLWLFTFLALTSTMLLLFCWKDEWRNLSLAFPAMYLAGVYSLEALYRSEKCYSI